MEDYIIPTYIYENHTKACYFALKLAIVLPPYPAAKNYSRAGPTTPISCSSTKSLYRTNIMLANPQLKKYPDLYSYTWYIKIHTGGSRSALECS